MIKVGVRRKRPATRSTVARGGFRVGPAAGQRRRPADRGRARHGGRTRSPRPQRDAGSDDGLIARLRGFTASHARPYAYVARVMRRATASRARRRRHPRQGIPTSVPASHRTAPPDTGASTQATRCPAAAAMRAARFRGGSSSVDHDAAAARALATPLGPKTTSSTASPSVHATGTPRRRTAARSAAGGRRRCTGFERWAQLRLGSSPNVDAMSGGDQLQRHRLPMSPRPIQPNVAVFSMPVRFAQGRANRFATVRSSPRPGARTVRLLGIRGVGLEPNLVRPARRPAPREQDAAGHGLPAWTCSARSRCDRPVRDRRSGRARGRARNSVRERAQQRDARAGEPERLRQRVAARDDARRRVAPGVGGLGPRSSGASAPAAISSRGRRSTATR